MVEQTRILVLDPDIQTAANCTRIFAEQGWGVDCASTFEEAQELFQRAHYDIAIIELMLPDIDGIEAWMRVRSISPNMAGIITTSSVSLLSSVYALERGILAYLQKPLKMPVLCSFVDRYLEHQRLSKERNSVDRELAGLSTLLSSITQASDIEQITKKTLAHLQAVFNFDWAVLCMQSEDKPSWDYSVHPHIMRDRSDMSDAQLQFVQERIVEVAHSLQPQVLVQSSTVNLDALASSLKQLGITDLALVPVIGSGELYGVLAIMNSSMAATEPAPCDVELLNIIGQAMALALDRTHLRMQLGAGMIHDLGTGTGSRAYLDGLIGLETARWKRYNRPFAVVLIDTLKMQGYFPNDRLRQTPRVVSEIAAMAQSLVRGADVIAHVAEWQLAILMPETVPAGAQQAISRLTQAIETHFSTDGARELPEFKILLPRENARNLDDLLRPTQTAFA